MGPPLGAVADVDDVAAKTDVERRLGPLKLPSVTLGEPVFGFLYLAPVVEALAEQAVLVADAELARCGRPGLQVLRPFA